MTDTTQRPKRLSLANKEEELFQKALRMSRLARKKSIENKKFYWVGNEYLDVLKETATTFS